MSKKINNVFKIKPFSFEFMRNLFLRGLIFSIVFASFNHVNTQVAYAARPDDCKTVSTLSTTGLGSSTPTTTSSFFTYFRCATLSTKGYTLNLYDGDDVKAGDEQELEFIGTSDFGVLGSGDIGKWIYRRTDNKKNYLAVQEGTDGITETHHYKTGTNTEWDQFAIENRSLFSVVSDNKKLPDYAGNDGKASNGKRFIWRLSINGTIKYMGKKLSESSVNRANILLVYDENMGPALDIVPSDKDGNFEFSRAYSAGEGVGNEELWVNAGTYINDPSAPDATIGTTSAEAVAKIKSAGTVEKIFLYIQMQTESGDKFEKFIPVDLATDFRFHKDNTDTLVDTKIDEINLTATDKKSEFSRAGSGEQSFIKETLGVDACGKAVDFSIGNAIISAFCSLGVLFHNFALSLMGKAFKALSDSLGV